MALCGYAYKPLQEGKNNQLHSQKIPFESHSKSSFWHILAGQFPLEFHFTVRPEQALPRAELLERLELLELPLESLPVEPQFTNPYDNI